MLIFTISQKVNRTTFSGSGYENFNQSLNNYRFKSRPASISQYPPTPEQLSSTQPTINSTAKNKQFLKIDNKSRNIKIDPFAFILALAAFSLYIYSIVRMLRFPK